MSALSPFMPYLPDGTTYLAVTAAAQSISPSPSGAMTDYRCVNNGTVAINILAQVQGPNPAAATTSTGITMLPGTVEVFTWPANVLLSVIAGGTGSTLSVTPGEGS